MAVLHYNFHSHQKLIGLSNSSVGIYARMLSYASANLTDGFVPTAYVRQIAGKSTAFTALLPAGLVDKCPGGFLLHDYLDYNPSKAQVQAKRTYARDRARAKRGGKSLNSSPQQEELVHGKVSDIGKDNVLRTTERSLEEEPEDVVRARPPHVEGWELLDPVGELERLRDTSFARIAGEAA